MICLEEARRVSAMVEAGETIATIKNTIDKVFGP